MKVLGIGNAIVDVICRVDDQYLIDNGLTKSAMKLVDELEFQKLLTTLKIEETISGPALFCGSPVLADIPAGRKY